MMALCKQVCDFRNALTRNQFTGSLAYPLSNNVLLLFPAEENECIINDMAWRAPCQGCGPRARPELLEASGPRALS